MKVKTCTSIWKYCALLLFVFVLPLFATAQSTMSGDSVIYEGIVVDGATRKPWCQGKVFAMNRLRSMAEVYVDANGKFRLAVSAKTAALPNLRIFVERICTPGNHGLTRNCTFEMPAPDRSQSNIKIAIGGGCGECSCI